jgi:5-formyltetrahydrofolate cyclo-ligase
MEFESVAVKRALRAEMKRRMEAMGPEMRAEYSRRILDHLRRQLAGAPLIAFVPLTSEPDILPLLRERWNAGRSVVLPRVAGEELILHEVDGEGALAVGAFGVLEPQTDAPRWAATAADCLVPGVAFDAEGYRLGRGKAYYDRLLATLPPEVRTTGVFFAFQEVERVPREVHDRPLHAVVTERGWRAAGGGS